MFAIRAISLAVVSVSLIALSDGIFFERLTQGKSSFVSSKLSQLSMKVRVSAFLLQTKAQAYRVYTQTNWCGIGARTNDTHDLGPLTALDTCCRNHDTCPTPDGRSYKYYRIFTV